MLFLKVFIDFRKKMFLFLMCLMLLCKNIKNLMENTCFCAKTLNTLRKHMLLVNIIKHLKKHKQTTMFYKNKCTAAEESLDYCLFVSFIFVFFLTAVFFGWFVKQRKTFSRTTLAFLTVFNVFASTYWFSLMFLRFSL